MLKKSITYTNPFTNQEVTEEHHFHISKADLVEMEMEEHNTAYEKDGEKLTGMQAKLNRIIDAEDGKAIIAEFKDIIRRSYGKKEGDRFRKSKEIWEEFSSSEAFSQLIFELCTDAKASAEFVNGIVPSNLEQIAAEVRKQAEETVAETVAETPVTVPPRVLQDGPPPEDPTGLTTPVTPQVLTQAQVLEMDSEELKAGLASGKYKLS